MNLTEAGPVTVVAGPAVESLRGGLRDQRLRVQAAVCERSGMSPPPRDAASQAQVVARTRRELERAHDVFYDLIADAEPDGRSEYGRQQKVAEASGLTPGGVRDIRDAVRRARKESGEPTRLRAMDEALRELPAARKRRDDLHRRWRATIAKAMPPPSPPGTRVSGAERQWLREFADATGLSVTRLRRLQKDHQQGTPLSAPRFHGRAAQVPRRGQNR